MLGSCAPPTSEQHVRFSLSLSHSLSCSSAALPFGAFAHGNAPRSQVQRFAGEDRHAEGAATGTPFPLSNVLC